MLIKSSIVVFLSVNIVIGILDSEISALMDIYYSTNGNNWSNGQINMWGVSDPCSVGWIGVTCDFNNHVSELDISVNNINGTLPDSIGNLSYLAYLSLRDNNLLRGTVPSTIQFLTLLSYLSFESDQLSGAIPSSIGALTGLQTLLLKSNKFSSFPSTVGTLSSLRVLEIQGNIITGTIPSELCQLQLHTLNMDKNRFSGTIPGNLDSMTEIMSLYLSHNQLSGTLPVMTSLTRLTQMDVSNNSFSVGCFPFDIVISSCNVGSTIFCCCRGFSTCGTGCASTFTVCPTPTPTPTSTPTPTPTLTLIPISTTPTSTTQLNDTALVFCYNTSPPVSNSSCNIILSDGIPKITLSNTSFTILNSTSTLTNTIISLTSTTIHFQSPLTISNSDIQFDENTPSVIQSDANMTIINTNIHINPSLHQFNVSGCSHLVNVTFTIFTKSSKTTMENNQPFYYSQCFIETDIVNGKLNEEDCQKVVISRKDKSLFVSLSDKQCTGTGSGGVSDSFNAAAIGGGIAAFLFVISSIVMVYGFTKRKNYLQGQFNRWRFANNSV